MKYTDPSEFFKYIIEKADINVINDTQKCLSMALDLLDSEKPYFKLFKIAFIFNAYKELIKAHNKDSNTKSACINKALKILTEECCTKDQSAIQTIGWLANIIYPNEWKSFVDKVSLKEIEDTEIVWEQPKSKPVITSKENNNRNNPNNISEGKNWTLKDINLEMIYCPAGSFMMGSPSNELGRDTDEKEHKVTISMPFYIGKYEVTQKEYESVMKENPSKFKGDNNPVECVSWYDAMEFCNKLNKKYANIIPHGYKFDLPTEAQWEYACRARTKTSLNSGKNITSENDSCYNLDEVGWYSYNSNNTTHEVGQKKPNAWGIYDMHGNVWEWCRDWKADYRTSVKVDPTGPNSGSDRVVRGGSWSSDSTLCRSAYRYFGYGISPRDTFGFRVVLVPI